MIFNAGLILSPSQNYFAPNKNKIVWFISAENITLKKSCNYLHPPNQN